MMRKLRAVAVAATTLLTLAACGTGTTTAPVEPIAPPVTEVVVEEPAAEGEGNVVAEPRTCDHEAPFSIGVSNNFIQSVFRTQMINGIQEAFDEYHAEGLVDRLVLENADTDINGQIQQIRNLINQGVDAILVNPSSATALNAVFDEAISQGILVFAVDQAVDNPDVINVTISQQDLGRVSAEWFAQQVGDGATIVTVEGTNGSPATIARWAGAEPVFAAHNITVETHGEGGFNQVQAQQVATDLLNTHPNIDGIWTYDGNAQGVFRAVEAAGRLNDLVIGGEARVGFMRMWNDALPEFSSVGIINPPGVGASALRIAVEMLQCRDLDPAQTVDGNIVVPLAPAITNENFAPAWDEVSGEADEFIVDHVMSRADVDRLFLN